MNCPYCNGKTKVEECASNGSVMFRRRICTECHRLSWSEERFALDPNTDKMIRRLRQTQQNEARRRKQ